jgi:hypothetical protein
VSLPGIGATFGPGLDLALAAWADERLVADASAESPIGIARQCVDGFKRVTYEQADTWLYANYCDFLVSSNQKPAPLNRFSNLLVDLCRLQLRMAEVSKPPRESSGRRVCGIRLRTSTDADGPGLVVQQLRRQSRALLDPAGSDAGSALVDAGPAGSAGFSKNNIQNNKRARAGGSESAIGKVVGESPALPAGSALARVEAASSPAAPAPEPASEPAPPSSSSGRSPSGGRVRNYYDVPQHERRKLVPVSSSADNGDAPTHSAELKTKKIKMWDRMKRRKGQSHVE